MDRKTFELKSRIEYCGETGLEGVGLDPAVLKTIKTLPPTVLAAVGYGTYFLIEWTRAWMVKQLRGREPDTGTYMPEGV